MDAAEQQAFSERIDGADGLDEWVAIDRELRARAEDGDNDALPLLRDVERACATFVQNAVMRTLAADAGGYDPAAFVAAVENAPDTDDATALAAWSMARMAQVLQEQPGRFQQMRRRLMARGRVAGGHDFTISDLMDDPDMAIAMREAEAYRADLDASVEGLVEARHSDSALVRDLAEAAWEALTADGDLDIVLADVDVALGAPGTEDVRDALGAIRTALVRGPEMRAYRQNAAIARAVQDLTDRIGAQGMRAVSDDPLTPQSQAVLQTLLGEVAPD